MPYLQIRDLVKRFDGQTVLDGFTLSVEEGELLALLGPSGSGKTTLLRLVAGFETADSGSIVAAGEDVTGVPPARRGFGMVFQHYALFPHMSVSENVAFGLEGWGLSRERVAERVAEVLELVDLAGFEPRRPSQISGGQQQRVALARALAPKPRLLLLDEPLSNLDPDLRDRTRRRLRRTLGSVGVTTLLVTHEQDEAFDLGDRVAVLAAGRLQQVGRPEALYAEPANRFVAGFVGHTATIRGTLMEGGRVVVGTDARDNPLYWRGVAIDEVEVGEQVELIVRPEALELRPATGEELSGVIGERRFAGMISYVSVELDDGQRLEVATEERPTVGERVGIAPSGRGPVPRIFAASGAMP